MPDSSEATMILFGMLIGLTIGAFQTPLYGYEKGTLYLNEDFRNFLLVVLLLFVIAIVLITSLTRIEFRWKHLLAAVFSAAIPAMLLSRAVFDGRILKRWTQPLRDLYGLLPHRDSPHVPQPFAEIQAMFEPEAQEFSLSNALVFAHASWWAYRPQSEIAALSAETGLPIAFLQKDNHVVIVLQIGESVILAFRGTDDMKDVVDDLRILPTSTQWGKVHRGFLSGINTLWPLVLDTVSRISAKEKGIWVTGHSLGAGMAVLASMKAATDGVANVNGIYAFAQPRVGNIPFKEKFDEIFEGKHYRFETPRDEVPKQPPLYFSPGLLVYLSRKDEVWRNPSWLRKFLDQMQRETLGLVGEHSMLEYLRIVEHARLNEYL